MNGEQTAHYEERIAQTAELALGMLEHQTELLEAGEASTSLVPPALGAAREAQLLVTEYGRDDPLYRFEPRASAIVDRLVELSTTRA